VNQAQNVCFSAVNETTEVWFELLRQHSVCISAHIVVITGWRQAMWTWKWSCIWTEIRLTRPTTESL